MKHLHRPILELIWETIGLAQMNGTFTTLRQRHMALRSSQINGAILSLKTTGEGEIKTVLLKAMIIPLTMMPIPKKNLKSQTEINILLTYHFLLKQKTLPMLNFQRHYIMPGKYTSMNWTTFPWLNSIKRKYLIMTFYLKHTFSFIIFIKGKETGKVQNTIKDFYINSFLNTF